MILGDFGDGAKNHFKTRKNKKFKKAESRNTISLFI